MDVNKQKLPTRLKLSGWCSISDIGTKRRRSACTSFAGRVIIACDALLTLPTVFSMTAVCCMVITRFNCHVFVVACCGNVIYGKTICYLWKKNQKILLDLKEFRHVRLSNKIYQSIKLSLLVAGNCCHN